MSKTSREIITAGMLNLIPRDEKTFLYCLEHVGKIGTAPRLPLENISNILITAESPRSKYTLSI